MTRTEMIQLIEPYKEKVTTTKKWDAFAKENGLPGSAKLVYNFGTWNDVKKALGISFTPYSYSKEELEKIAKKHKSQMISKPVWDKYSRENGLPASNTFIDAFEKWSKLKEFLGLQNEIRKDSYTKQDIKRVLREHATNYVNREQWDVYAKENRLPTYKTIKKHFAYDEILKLVKKPKKINFTKEELTKIALNYKEVFLTASMTQWDKFASEKKLPTSHTYYKRFGSWRKAKNEIIFRE